MKIRVLRLLEYTYQDAAAMTRDMERWAVAANGVLVGGPFVKIKSACLPLEVLEERAGEKSEGGGRL